jgi:hypothetical protein
MGMMPDCSEALEVGFAGSLARKKQSLQGNNPDDPNNIFLLGVNAPPPGSH